MPREPLERKVVFTSEPLERTFALFQLSLYCRQSTGELTKRGLLCSLDFIRRFVAYFSFDRLFDLNDFRPGQKHATFQHNILQLCCARHVADVCPACCTIQHLAYSNTCGQTCATCCTQQRCIMLC